MEQRADVAVIGGGVVGLFCAYFLIREGFSVTVLTDRDPRKAASYGNAGYLAAGFGPSHAPPRSLFTLLKWALSPSSHIRASWPFLVAELRPGGWLSAFLRQRRLYAGREYLSLLRRLCVEGVKLFEQVVTREGLAVDYRRAGLLEVFREKVALERAVHEARSLAELGASIRELSEQECLNLEASLKGPLAGGLLYEEDAWANPAKCLLSMRLLVTKLGADMLHEEVRGLRASGTSVEALRTTGGEIRARSIIIAAGASSSKLLSQLGLRNVIAPARGYGIITSSVDTSLSRPVMCGDVRVATSQLPDGRMKATGYFELVRGMGSFPRNRFERLQRAASSYLKPFEGAEIEERWVGYRPCTPDGLPLVGRSSRLSNLYLATGHCRLGLTLAAITGRLMAKAVKGEHDELMEPLLPQRYGI
jgi:D-amino-acid dehydrogenase